MLRMEWIGGYRLGYFDGWGYAYTDGEGSAGSRRWRVCPPHTLLHVLSITKFLSGKSSP
jgi:hypothetical protein